MCANITDCGGGISIGKDFSTSWGLWGRAHRVVKNACRLTDLSTKWRVSASCSRQVAESLPSGKFTTGEVSSPAGKAVIFRSYQKSLMMKFPVSEFEVMRIGPSNLSWACLFFVVDHHCGDFRVGIYLQNHNVWVPNTTPPGPGPDSLPVPTHTIIEHQRFSLFLHSLIFGDSSMNWYEKIGIRLLLWEDACRDYRVGLPSMMVKLQYGVRSRQAFGREDLLVFVFTLLEGLSVHEDIGMANKIFKVRYYTLRTRICRACNGPLDITAGARPYSWRIYEPVNESACTWVFFPSTKSPIFSLATAKENGVASILSNKIPTTSASISQWWARRRGTPGWSDATALEINKCKAHVLKRGDSQVSPFSHLSRKWRKVILISWHNWPAKSDNWNFVKAKPDPLFWILSVSGLVWSLSTGSERWWCVHCFPCHRHTLMISKSSGAVLHIGCSQYTSNLHISRFRKTWGSNYPP